MTAYLRLFSFFAMICLVAAVPAIAAEKAEVVIDGVEGDALNNVREALALPRDVVRDDRVDRQWMERLRGQAEEKIRRALEPFGYYDARVSAKIETEDETTKLHVTVEPGEPVRITGVNVTVSGPGREEEGLTRLAAQFPLQRGDVLLQQQYEQAKSQMKSRAVESGYIDADFSLHEIRIKKTGKTAEIRLALETGPRYHFGGVSIEGAPQYPDDFLRRYIAFEPDETFSYSKLGATQLNFANAERFRQVSVMPEKEKARENRVPVRVNLVPAPRRTLHPGIGYGTDTGARFSIRFRDLNVRQRGHEFNSNFFLSERLQGLVTQYTIPSAHNIKSSTGIQLTLQRQDVTTYVSRLVAVELDRNYSFGKGGVVTLYLRVQQEDFTIGDQDSSSRLVMPGCRIIEDRYDNIIRPRKGYRYALDLRGAHQYLGSDTGLIQLITEASALAPLPWRMALMLRGKGAVTGQNDPLADLPASLRFFAGGDRSVRGYSYQSLGPIDSSGQVEGGRHLVSGSVELFRDFFSNFAASLFYDAGNAFNDFNDIRLYQGAGIGIHYYSPVGAINLSLARQIGEEHPALRIHFTLGFEI